MYIEVQTQKDGTRDWRAEEDAQTILRAKEINADRERKQKAYGVIKDTQAALNSAVKGKGQIPNMKNPATLGKLPVNWQQ